MCKSKNSPANTHIFANICTKYMCKGCTDKLQMPMLGHMPQFNDMIASPLLDLFRSTKTSCENGSFEDA